MSQEELFQNPVPDAQAWGTNKMAMYGLWGTPQQIEVLGWVEMDYTLLQGPTKVLFSSSSHHKALDP